MIVTIIVSVAMIGSEQVNTKCREKEWESDTHMHTSF